MLEQQLDDFMVEEGYTKVPSNLPEFIFYSKSRYHPYKVSKVMMENDF